jgi:hypothetical protein
MTIKKDKEFDDLLQARFQYQVKLLEELNQKKANRIVELTGERDQVKVKFEQNAEL